MGSVKVFKCKRGHEAWEYVVGFLRDGGVEVCDHKEPADVSIVLSGRFENPLVFDGKKVMAYDAMEWLRSVPAPQGFKAYMPVLEEYYDDFIDLTGLNVQERTDKVMDYIRGLNV